MVTMVIGLSLTANCWLFTGFEYWQILPSHHKTPHSVNYVAVEEAIALSPSVSTFTLATVGTMNPILATKNVLYFMTQASLRKPE